jgi:5'-nucleotidase
MNDINWSAVIGAAGGICSAMSFLPQVLKVRRQGGRDLSMAMLALLLGGAVLWFVYGLINQATAVVVANVAIMALVSTTAIMKIVLDRRGARQRQPRIAIDMDEVMADALTEQLRRYNAAYGTAITAADLSGRHLEQVVPPAHREAAEAMFDAAFFEDLDVLPDCQEVVSELADRYEVFIASAAMDVPRSFDAKYRWLRRHFPFIPPSHIVFCGDKTIVDADYLIDDRPRHFTRFRGQALLFSAPHNAGETAYTRVGSWKEVRAYFAGLESDREHRRVRTNPGLVASRRTEAPEA